MPAEMYDPDSDLRVVRQYPKEIKANAAEAKIMKWHRYT